MNKIIIIAIAILMPAMASAATIVPGTNGDSPGVGQSFRGTYNRLYALEIAVAEFQDQNTALRSQVNLLQAQTANQAPTATGIAPTDSQVADLQRRVSALETVTHAIQNSLVYVIQLLTEALNTIKTHA